MKCPICEKSVNSYIFDDIQEEIHQCKSCMFTKTITPTSIYVTIKNYRYFLCLTTYKNLKTKIKKINIKINYFRSLKRLKKIKYDPLKCKKNNQYIAEYKDDILVKIWKSIRDIAIKINKGHQTQRIIDAINNNTEYYGSYWKVI